MKEHSQSLFPDGLNNPTPTRPKWPVCLGFVRTQRVYKARLLENCITCAKALIFLNDQNIYRRTNVEAAARVVTQGRVDLADPATLVV